MMATAPERSGVFLSFVCLYPSVIFAAMSDFEHSLKNERRKFREHGVFYTDEKLALLLKDIVGNTLEVYDPTCGNGNLLAVFPDEVWKYGQELDPEQLAVAAGRLVNFEGVAGDTLKAPAFGGKKFKAIVGNYPFSVKWEPFEDERFSAAPCLPPASKADYAFLLHIIHYLDDNGTAAVINFPGVTYRGQREGKIRQWMIEQGYVRKVIRIEKGYFADTNIETVVFVLRKDAFGGEIEFSDHETGRSRAVSVDEVRNNGFSLSVSTYLAPPVEEKEPVDPLQLESDARSAFLAYIRTRLEFSMMVSSMENIPFTPLLDEVQKIVDEYRAKTLNKFGNM